MLSSDCSSVSPAFIMTRGEFRLTVSTRVFVLPSFELVLKNRIAYSIWGSCTGVDGLRLPVAVNICFRMTIIVVHRREFHKPGAVAIEPWLVVDQRCHLLVEEALQKIKKLCASNSAVWFSAQHVQDQCSCKTGRCMTLE